MVGYDPLEGVRDIVVGYGKGNLVCVAVLRVHDDDAELHRGGCADVRLCVERAVQEPAAVDVDESWARSTTNEAAILA